MEIFSSCEEQTRFGLFFFTRQLSPASLESAALSKPDTTTSWNISHLILALQGVHLPPLSISSLGTDANPPPAEDQ